MSVREALESALQETWSFDELDVYADHLQAEGDPRGELIALDRRPSTTDSTWAARRRDALVRWLGDDLATRSGHLVQHAFIHELRCGSHGPDFFDSPLGPLVRGYAIWGDHPRVGAAIARLASQPRLWLRRLSIAYWGARPYEAELCAKLIAATPRLEELHLIGRPAFRRIDHPALRRVVLDDTMTIATPLDVERTRRHGGDWATGWPIAHEDLELLQQTLANLFDCNLLYTWYEQAFADSVPVLLARAAAAGVVSVDGPIARVVPATYQDTHDWEAYRRTNLFVDVGVVAPMNLGNVQDHVRHLAGCLHEYRLAPPARQAVADYLAIVVGIAGYYYPPRVESRRVLRSLVPQLALALDRMIERRSLLGEVRSPGWVAHEALASLLSLPGAQRRVELRID